MSRASEEPPSSALYTVLLADIEHHLAVLNRKARAAERRHIEAAQGRERLDAARDRATKIMAERFAQSPPRGLLRALLERAWSDVLAPNTYPWKTSCWSVSRTRARAARPTSPA